MHVENLCPERRPRVLQVSGSPCPDPLSLEQVNALLPPFVHSFVDLSLAPLSVHDQCSYRPKWPSPSAASDNGSNPAIAGCILQYNSFQTFRDYWWNRAACTPWIGTEIIGHQKGTNLPERTKYLLICRVLNLQDIFPNHPRSTTAEKLIQLRPDEPRYWAPCLAIPMERGVA